MQLACHALAGTVIALSDADHGILRTQRSGSNSAALSSCWGTGTATIDTPTSHSSMPILSDCPFFSDLYHL
jgi:hypothetical protein